MNNLIGEFVARECKMDWVVHMELVNVIINDDWKGIYYLSEAINRNNSQGRVGKDGYIFENDAYFWKPNEIYFKIDGQIDQLGYTFKYPDNIKRFDDERIDKLKKYMEMVDGKMNQSIDDVMNYIDEDSFISWIMVKDIMLCGDSGGSNMYYYIYDLDENNLQLNKLHMGPLWDFDTCLFDSKDWYDGVDSWSMQHDKAAFTYFPILFENGVFYNDYKERWDEVSLGLQLDLDNYLENYYKDEGYEIEESYALDYARWGGGIRSLREQIDYDKDFINYRIQAIDNLLKCAK